MRHTERFNPLFIGPAHPACMTMTAPLTEWMRSFQSPLHRGSSSGSGDVGGLGGYLVSIPSSSGQLIRRSALPKGLPQLPKVSIPSSSGQLIRPRRSLGPSVDASFNPLFIGAAHPAQRGTHPSSCRTVSIPSSSGQLIRLAVFTNVAIHRKFQSPLHRGSSSAAAFV